MRQSDAIRTACDIVRRSPVLRRHARLGDDWVGIETDKLENLIAAALCALSYLETVDYHPSIHPSTVAQDNIVDALRDIGAMV